MATTASARRGGTSSSPSRVTPRARVSASTLDWMSLGSGVATHRTAPPATATAARTVATRARRRGEGRAQLIRSRPRWLRTPSIGRGLRLGRVEGGGFLWQIPVSVGIKWKVALVALAINATSSNWFTDPAFRLCDDANGVSTNCVRIDFTGPDFQRIIDRFSNLDLGSIIQALRAIVNFLRTIDGPEGNGIAKVLDTKLPLVDRSISEILDIAQKFADKIEEIANDPAGSVQELNNIIAAALGEPMASLTITPSGLHNLTQAIAIVGAVAGKFKLTFKNATTRSIAYNAPAADVKSALEALKTIGKNNVDVTGSAGRYTITFQGKFSGTSTDLPVLVADTKMLVGTEILDFDTKTGILNFNLDIPFRVGLARPFSFDPGQLAAARLHLPDAISAITSFVSLSASGNLDVNASATIHLRLGLDLTGPVVINTTDQGKAVDEVQTIKVSSGATGTFKLHYTADTGNLHPGISAADLQTALQGVAGSGNVTVTAQDVFGGTLYTVTFANTLAHTNVTQISADTSLLSAGTVTIATKVEGASTDEQETLYVKATAGSFKLTFNNGSDHVTGDLNVGISAGDLQPQLRTLLGGGANFNVSLLEPNLYQVTFVGTLAHTNVSQLTADISNTVGGERTFFLKTGPSGTSIDASASASGNNLNFEAKLGPFGLFVNNGSASLGGQIHVGLLDARSAE